MLSYSKVARLDHTGITVGKSGKDMSFWKKLFGIADSPAKSSFKANNVPSPSAAQVPAPPSEAALAWIRAGGLIGGVEIESDMPPALGGNDACRKIVHEALAEFDALHPGRRLSEPVELSASPNTPARFIVRVNLKIQSLADGRANLMNVEKDFFEIFQRRGLPYWANRT